MNKLLTGILSLFLITTSYSQETQRLQTITTTSEVMDEERTIKVYLPRDYSEEKTYPVIYITDGSSDNFKVAAGYLDGISEPYFNIIPQSILVGIVHNVRNDDLDVHDRESGKVFMKYLFEEAVPYIDSTYSTSGFNTMVGHSNGAEYNHFLMMAEDTPFRGYISMSTSFNTDVRDRLTDFFQNYQGKDMYYFIANATWDSPERPKYGKEFAELYEKHPNTEIHLISKTYEANHMSIVPVSLYDGLRFIFKDYYAVGSYDSIIEYRENYLSNLEQNYGLNGSYNISDLENFVMDIITNKKTNEYEHYVELVQEHKLFFGKGIDPINIANHYYLMDAYQKTIEYYNDALENYNSYEEQFGEHFENMYKRMLKRPIASYENLGKIDELIDFLKKSTAVLPEKNTFFVNYKIAQLSQEHQISLDKGKQAVEYCKSNFVENTNISMDDVLALSNQLDSSVVSNN